METLTQCPLCKGTSFIEYLTCKDYTVSQEPFHIVSCTQCTFKFTNPRPERDVIGKYYESDDYISHSNSKKGLINKIYQSIRNISIREKIKLIDFEAFNSEKSILDIGCGTGEFLNKCGEAGWKTEGIEPNLKARNAAVQQYKLKVGDESDLNNLNRQFGIISMWHVLEHVHELNTRIEQIHKLLLNSGKAIIAVPNLTSWDAGKYGKHWAAYDVPRHLYHFSPERIKKLFADHGLLHHRSLPMKFDSFYVSMLSEKYKTGKSNPPMAFINGLRSNMHAGSLPEKYSSVIYIFKKA